MLGTWRLADVRIWSFVSRQRVSTYFRRRRPTRGCRCPLSERGSSSEDKGARHLPSRNGGQVAGTAITRAAGALTAQLFPDQSTKALKQRARLRIKGPVLCSAITLASGSTHLTSRRKNR